MSKNKVITCLCPAFFLVLGSWIYFSAGSMSATDRKFPQIVAVLMILIAVIDFVVELKKEQKNRFENLNWINLAECLCSLFLYVFLLKKIGFYFDTLLLTMFIMWLLGYRRYKVLFASSFLITSVVFGAFYFLLRVPMPTVIL